jgi:hypothetical protein
MKQVMFVFSPESYLQRTEFFYIIQTAKETDLIPKVKFLLNIKLFSR